MLSRTASASVLSGTRCGWPTLVRWPGMVYVAESRSISSHVASLASLLCTGAQGEELETVHGGCPGAGGANGG